MNTKKRYYLACSGGVDSMVLAFLLKRLSVDFELLHVNFQLRGEESDKDEELVKAYADKLGVKVHVTRFNTLEIHKEGGNLEQICRDLRYQWFQTFLNKTPSSRLLIAHHLDDQVETFYLNLARKSGVVGLSSLAPYRNRIIRPLLGYTKDEIYAIAKKYSIPWREDKSNHENDFRRNKLRNIFIPYIESTLPTIKESVITLIDAFQETKKNILSELEQTIDFSSSFELSVEKFSNWDITKKHIFLNAVGLRATVLEELEKLAFAEKGRYIEVNNWFISKNNSSFSWDKIEPEKKYTLELEEVKELPKIFEKTAIYLDASKLVGSLSLRCWEEGDRLSAIGVKGSKLVSKIINEAKLSTYQKRQVLVVHDEETIHWIVGIKIGSKAVATPDSENILKVTVRTIQ